MHILALKTLFESMRHVNNTLNLKKAPLALLNIIISFWLILREKCLLALSFDLKVMEKQRQDIDVKFLIGPPKFETVRAQILDGKKLPSLAETFSHISCSTLSYSTLSDRSSFIARGSSS